MALCMTGCLARKGGAHDQDRPSCFPPLQAGMGGRPIDGSKLFEGSGHGKSPDNAQARGGVGLTSETPGAPHASASRERARIHSAAVMAMFSAFHAVPFRNAAA